MRWYRSILWPNLCQSCERGRGGVLGEWDNIGSLWRCPECDHVYQQFAAHDWDMINRRWPPLDPLDAAPEISHALGEVTNVDNIVA